MVKLVEPSAIFQILLENIQDNHGVYELSKKLFNIASQK